MPELDTDSEINRGPDVKTLETFIGTRHTKYTS